MSADLLDADSLVEASKDCDIFVHVASPNLLEDPKDENLVLGPAIEGTENAINACFKNNVKRIIITSSCLTIIDWNKEDEADETQWREIDGSTPLYDKSKILAEKKAWEMIANQPEGKNLELVTNVIKSTFYQFIINIFIFISLQKPNYFEKYLLFYIIIIFINFSFYN